MRSEGSPAHWPARLRELWRRHPEGMSIELLRVGMGVIWVLNLLFVIDPENQFFGTFQSTAQSYAPTTYGGSALPDWVAAHASVFAWVVALVTAYLALAFLLGATTRFACLVGFLFSAVFLVTQVGSTFNIPGGTDVGPHPLYMLISVVLFLGGAGRYLALDH
ncbi:MAG: hypothetical protein L3K01_00625 [Thermoplasmata archaeon]|nr:hypothetical protein [Thermoplasmata archaeon]